MSLSVPLDKLCTGSRRDLESLAAQLATPNITQDDLTSLEHIIGEMKKAERLDDVSRLIDLDFDFHKLIVERCQHGRLQRALGDMQLQVRIFRIVTKRTDYETFRKTHGDLLDALRTGDPQIVQQTVYSHVMGSADLALAAVPDDDVLSIPETSGGAYSRESPQSYSTCRLVQRMGAVARLSHQRGPHLTITIPIPRTGIPSYFLHHLLDDLIQPWIVNRLREDNEALPIPSATLRRSLSYTEKRDGSKIGDHPEKRG